MEHSGAYDLTAMLVSVTVLGLLWGRLFVLTRNLWLVVANRAAWNVTIYSAACRFPETKTGAP